MPHNFFNIKETTLVLGIMEENHTVILNTQMRQSMQHYG